MIAADGGCITCCYVCVRHNEMDTSVGQTTKTRTASRLGTRHNAGARSRGRSEGKAGKTACRRGNRADVRTLIRDVQRDSVVYGISTGFVQMSLCS